MIDNELFPERGIGGEIKSLPEDFVVEEIPAYLPGGAGEHLYLWIQKRDVPAELLVKHVARALTISPDEVGVAGLKDRRAVTRQWISVPASAAGNIESINTDSVQVLDSRWHSNKLRTGHLRGNRFEILVRNPMPGAEQLAEPIAARIRQWGIPNRFGNQRFGHQKQTLNLGLSLLKGEVSPRSIPFKRRKFLSRLALSAVQSDLFNEVLNRRISQGWLHQVQAGDVMQLAESGAMFLVDDVAVEQSRFNSRETIPTGPLFGPKMKSPAGCILELEAQVLADSGLTRAMFTQPHKLTPGGRRPLLLFPEGLEIRNEPHGLRICFALPAGAYATVVLDEFIGAEPLSRDETSEPT